MKSFLKKISSSRLGFFLKSLVGRFEYVIMGYYHDPSTVSLLKEISTEDKPFLLNPSELYNIYGLAKFQNRIDGEFAEVGVFKGATAKAICEAKDPSKRLFLFDTFEGLPEVDTIDKEMFSNNQYASGAEIVKAKLEGYENIEIHKGYFPEETGRFISDEAFAFVHLDVDIYQSTKESLAFFYPRLSKGGMIVSHDYHAAGVRKAFDEFCTSLDIPVFQFSTSQCLVQKL